MENRTDLATRCVHAGEQRDIHGSPHTPIYTATTFAYASSEELLAVVAGSKAGAFYTRFGMNPTIQALETKLASLEGAESALAFSAGMAAEAALFLTHGREGIICIGDAYGGTLELLGKQLPLLGIETHFILGSELDRLEGLLQAGAGLVFFETPTNPVLEVFDIRKISEISHRYGALVVVDNTFASPVNQLPLNHGADIVVHSATKYLGGHSDLTAGALMGPKRLLEPVWNWRKNLGTVPAPETAALLARSLRSLVVRVTHQSRAAREIAKSLQGHPRVRRVLYPGLPDSAGHKIAAGQMCGFGGVLSLEFDGDLASTMAMVDRLELFAIAPSLGGVESLVTQPVTSTHYGVSPEERVRRGIGDNLVRLSIGLEGPDDLIRDLQQALAG